MFFLVPQHPPAWRSISWALLFSALAAMFLVEPPLASAASRSTSGAAQPELISVGLSGAASTADAPSDMSADGRYVVFSSSSANLVPGDTNALTDVFVRDRVTGSVTRVDVTSSGHQTSAAFTNFPGESVAPQISADGRVVVFFSQADNLYPWRSYCPQGCPAEFGLNLYVHYMDTGITAMVDTTASGLPPGAAVDGGSFILSKDGRYVAWGAGAPNNLVDDPSVSAGNTYVKDLETGAVDLVSRDATGMPFNSWSGFAFPVGLSFDGNTVVFATYSSSTVGERLWVRNLSEGTLKRIYLGELVNHGYLPEGLSPDGRVLVGATAFQFTPMVWNLNDPSPLEPRLPNRNVQGQCQRVLTNSDGSRFFITSNADIVGDGAGGGIFALSNDGAVTRIASVPGPPGNDICLYAMAGNGTSFLISTTEALSSADTNGAGDLYLVSSDAVPPVSSDDAPSGWVDYGVTVDLSASDNAGGSGVKEIHYSESGAQSAGDTTVTGSSASVPVSADGTTTISYYAVDNAGNQEQPRQAVVRIDTVAPTLSGVAMSLNPMSVSDTTTLTATAADNLSGVAGGEYYIGTDPGVGAGTAMSLDGSTLSASIAGSSVAPGVYTVCVRDEDLAGNWGTPGCTLLVLSTQPCVTSTRSSLVVTSGVVACVSRGGEIKGSVRVASGGTLWATGGTITGSVAAQAGATAVTICGTAVGGSISATGVLGPILLGGASTSDCAGDTVGGSVSLSGNGADITLSQGRIGGSVSVTQNSGSISLSGDSVTHSVSLSSNTGGLSLTDSQIGASLSITSNSSGVTVTGNTVGAAARITDNSGGFVYSDNQITGPATISGNT